VKYAVHQITIVLDSIAKTMTTTAVMEAVPWPFFTLEHFAGAADTARRLSQLQLLVFCPLVKSANRDLWHYYARNNTMWIEEGQLFSDVQGSNDHANTTNVYGNDIFRRDIQKRSQSVATATPPSIPFAIHSEPKGNPLPRDSLASQFLPFWQSSPVPDDYSVINFDMLQDSTIRQMVDEILGNKAIGISPVIGLEQLFDSFVSVSLNNSIGQAPPKSLFVQPVFDRLDGQRSDAEVVGFIFGAFEWDTVFENALQGEENEVITVVIENNCGSMFTYEVAANNVTFLGYGDFHDPSYASLGPIEPFLNQTGDLFTCRYLMSIYPSEAFQNKYQSELPALFTLSVVLVLLFISVVFCCYDWCLTRGKQEKQPKSMEDFEEVGISEQFATERKLGKQAANELRPCLRAPERPRRLSRLILPRKSSSCEEIPR
jgi:hypothetical protein